MCKLVKSLYGLKQAPRAWIPNLPLICLIFYIFLHLNLYKSIKSQGTKVVILLFSADDIIIIGSSPLLVQQVIDNLGEVFDMKDMGQPLFFLGFQIICKDIGDLVIFQSKYVKDLLKKHPWSLVNHVLLLTNHILSFLNMKVLFV